jgi:hypothetical protein
MVITNKKVTMKKEKIKNTQYRNSFFIMRVCQN